MIRFSLFYTPSDLIVSQIYPNSNLRLSLTPAARSADVPTTLPGSHRPSLVRHVSVKIGWESSSLTPKITLKTGYLSHKYRCDRHCLCTRAFQFFCVCVVRCVCSPCVSAAAVRLDRKCWGASPRAPFLRRSGLGASGAGELLTHSLTSGL